MGQGLIHLDKLVMSVCLCHLNHPTTMQTTNGCFVVSWGDRRYTGVIGDDRIEEQLFDFNFLLRSNSIHDLLCMHACLFVLCFCYDDWLFM